MFIDEAESVILFGGVDRDGGGWAIGPNGGVNPIGPWGPLIARLAAGVGQLVGAIQALPEGRAREEVVRVAQDTADVLSRELGLGSTTKTLMYIADDGPWCGTGRDGKLHPGPLPTVSKHALV